MASSPLGSIDTIEYHVRTGASVTVRAWNVPGPMAPKLPGGLGKPQPITGAQWRGDRAGTAGDTCTLVMAQDRAVTFN